MESELAELKEQVKQLTARVNKVQDEAEIRKIHFKYGYYLDKCLYKEVVDMFSNHPDAYVEFLGSRYRRKEGIKRLYINRFARTFVNGRNGPVHGFLLDHPMLQDIIDVNESGTHAWGRLRALMSAGTHDTVRESHPRGHAQWWEGGQYENEYRLTGDPPAYSSSELLSLAAFLILSLADFWRIKEDGVWKLFRYRYFPFWHANFESGWSHTKPNFIPWPSKTFPDDPYGPDEIIEQKMLWPDTRVIPFHYPHPVTGKQVEADDLRAPHYGKDVNTADPPLSLALPKDQQEALKASGKTDISGVKIE